MLSLIAVCWLVGQTTFAIPEGWRAEEIYTGGTRLWSGSLTLEYCSPECEQQRGKPWVRLRRDVAIGVTVKAPKGCDIEIRTEKKESSQ